MTFLKRLLCAFTWHSWEAVRADARVLCKCSFCGTERWISYDCFDQRK